ncbi:MAG TPA: adenylate cyclase [Cyanobacteria bacterium UBA8803]|nr:adenylate cyclase [Cyanobacteria bacterium UBA9273]HBL61341.1 adenylate cyclase [Cyanobacteria bacterium UBA8803]
MLNKPILKPGFNWETLGTEDVFIISERDSIWLTGRLYQLLMPLMDGKHTVDEIAERLPEISTSEVYYALMLMQQRGYIVESDDTLPLDLAIFCQHLNVAPQEANSRLQATKVAVKSFGANLPISEFIGNLQALQIQVSEEADIEAVLTDNYLNAELEDYNREALERSRPWLLVKPAGTVLGIGPIFTPGKTGCWQCLCQRLRNNRPIEELIQKHKQDLTPLMRPLASLVSTAQTALGIAATEIWKWIVRGENPRLEGKLLLQDTLTLETQNHILVKRPQCPNCGDIVNGLNREPMPIILGHRKKAFTADGGYRCCSPEETLRKYQHHISPITGVVRELRTIYPNSDGLTHCYVATHHFATMFDDLTTLRQNIGGRSAGKGKTDLQARVSALCEAIERYSGVFQGNEFRKQASYRQLGDRAIHPNACMQFSQEQYQNRQEWNTGCYGWFQRVPAPFDEDREIEWTPVWSLTHEQFKYLPTAYCYYGYPRPEKPDCWADSNGCAAGNTLEEAILQGFLELVERDCVALWWYNRLQKPAVDLDSFEDPYFPALKEYYRSLNRELWVLDLTSDLNIPCFAAITRRSNCDIEDITFGFGAHFDPQIAVSRALTEVNQILPNVLAAKADGSTNYPLSSAPLAIKWWKTATLANQPYLASDRTIAAKVRADYTKTGSEDLLEDIMLCKEIAAKNGMEMLVTDLTRPDIGLRVVKVIVPGMRHWWKRLGWGRLYEVPVKMGWLKEPLAENQLNPFPLWM